MEEIDAVWKRVLTSIKNQRIIWDEKKFKIERIEKKIRAISLSFPLS